MAHALPNAWNVYNLESSPFFQETLEAAEHSPRPLSLFVGRETELDELRGRIHAAGPNGSRQAVAGSPGVGKTTLVQALKARLLQDGYLSTDSLIAIQPDDTPASFFGRVLAGLFDVILANRPNALANEAMQAAQVLVRAARLTNMSGGFSIAGIGGSVGQGVTPLNPGDVLIDGPRVMRDLMRLVSGSDAHGVILHVNNLEVLSERDQKVAAELLRGLRDPMLMHPGLHFVLVGTPEAITAIVGTFTQVRNIFSTLVLEPLSNEDVHAMLMARYQYLRYDENRPVIEPVDRNTIDRLYALFRGDLRGLLKALDDGTSILLGLTGRGKPEPLTAGDLFPVLQQRYAAEIAQLPEARVAQLRMWGEKDPGSQQTQATLAKLWGVSQAAVSNALKTLIERGYVVALPRQGSEATRYVLSGVGQLVFGHKPAQGDEQTNRSRRQRRRK